MPYFSTEVDVEVDEFLECCSVRELDKVVEWLVEESQVNERLANKLANRGEDRSTGTQNSFTDGLTSLGEAFYRISTEDQETIENLIAKYKWL